MNQQFRDFLLFSFIVTLVYTWMYRNLFGLGELIYGDLAPFYPHISNWLDVYYSSWIHQNLGYPGSATEAAIYNSVVQFIAGGSSILAQKILFLIVSPVSALTMFILLSYYTRSRFAWFVGGLFYAVNPFPIGLYYGGGPGGGMLIHYAIFPLQLLFLLNILSERGDRRINIIALSIFLAISTGFTTQAVLWFLPFILTFMLTFIIAKKSIKYAWRTFLSLLVSGILLILLLLPSQFIYFQMLVNYYTSPGSAIGLYTSVPVNIEALQQELLDNYQFQTFGLLGIFTYLTILIAVITAFVRKQFKYVFSIFFTISFILLVAHLGGRGQIWWLYNAFPPLYSVSLFKMKMILFQALYLIIPFFIDEASERGFIDLRLSRTHKYRKFSSATRTIVSFTLIATILIPTSAYNVWPDNSSTEYMMGNLDLSSYVVPPAYNDIRLWMDENLQQNESFRIFWLPMDPAIESILMMYFHDTPSYYPRYEDKDYIQPITNYLQNAPQFGWTNGLGRLLAPAGVKYIIVNLATVENEFFPIVDHTAYPYLFSWGRSWSQSLHMAGDPVEYAKLLDREENLMVVERNEVFVIYENLDYTPFITVYDRVFFVAPKNLNQQATIDQTPESQLSVYVDIPNVQYMNNHGGLPEWNTIISPGRVGKLFPESTNLLITSIDFHVRENAGANVTLSLFLSPDVGVNHVESYNLTIPANQSPDWLSVPINLEWPYDKLFVSWFAHNASAQWGYDNGMPYDDYYCADLDESDCWTRWNDRPWVSVKTWRDVSGAESWVKPDKSVNLIRNPTFDEDTSNWSMDENWSIDRDIFSSELNTLKGVNTADCIHCWISASPQSFQVKGGSSYSISGWVKLENVEQSFVRLRFIDEHGNVVAESAPLAGTDGSRDWWEFSHNGIILESAVVGNVEVFGGWSLDKTQPGETWFTNMSFYQGYHPQLSPLRENQFEWYYETVLASSSKHLIDKVPGFDGVNLMTSTTMLPFNASVKSVEQFLSIVDGVVLMGDLVETDETRWVAEHPLLLSLYEAESSMVPSRGLWIHTEGSTFSNNRAAMVNGTGAGSMMFFAPRNSYYDVAFRVKMPPSFYVEVDGEQVELQEFSIDEDEFRWLEADAGLLQKGWHNLSISVDGASLILDQIVMLSNIEAPIGLEQISSSSNPQIVMHEDNAALHKIKIDSQKPVLLVMLNSYHPNWNAYIDGQKFEHYAAPIHMYWANLYRVTSAGSNSLEVMFDEQSTRNISLAICGVIWVWALGTLVFLQRTRISWYRREIINDAIVVYGFYKIDYKYITLIIVIIIILMLGVLL